MALAQDQGSASGYYDEYGNWVATDAAPVEEPLAAEPVAPAQEYAPPAEPVGMASDYTGAGAYGEPYAPPAEPTGYASDYTGESAYPAYQDQATQQFSKAPTTVSEQASQDYGWGNPRPVSNPSGVIDTHDYRDVKTVGDLRGSGALYGDQGVGEDLYSEEELAPKPARTNNLSIGGQPTPLGAGAPIMDGGGSILGAIPGAVMNASTFPIRTMAHPEGAYNVIGGLFDSAEEKNQRTHGANLRNQTDVTQTRRGQENATGQDAITPGSYNSYQAEIDRKQYDLDTISQASDEIYGDPWTDAFLPLVNKAEANADAYNQTVEAERYRREQVEQAKRGIKGEQYIDVSRTPGYRTTPAGNSPYNDPDFVDRMSPGDELGRWWNDSVMDSASPVPASGDKGTTTLADGSVWGASGTMISPPTRDLSAEAPRGNVGFDPSGWQGWSLPGMGSATLGDVSNLGQGPRQAFDAATGVSTGIDQRMRALTAAQTADGSVNPLVGKDARETPYYGIPSLYDDPADRILDSTAGGAGTYPTPERLAPASGESIGYMPPDYVPPPFNVRRNAIEGQADGNPQYGRSFESNNAALTPEQYWAGRDVPAVDPAAVRYQYAPDSDTSSDPGYGRTFGGGRGPGEYNDPYADIYHGVRMGRDQEPAGSGLPPYRPEQGDRMGREPLSPGEHTGPYPERGMDVTGSVPGYRGGVISRPSTDDGQWLPDNLDFLPQNGPTINRDFGGVMDIIKTDSPPEVDEMGIPIEGDATTTTPSNRQPSSSPRYGSAGRVDKEGVAEEPVDLSVTEGEAIAPSTGETYGTGTEWVDDGTYADDGSGWVDGKYGKSYSSGGSGGGYSSGGSGGYSSGGSRSSGSSSGFNRTDWETGSVGTPRGKLTSIHSADGEEIFQDEDGTMWSRDPETGEYRKMNKKKSKTTTAAKKTTVRNGDIDPSNPLYARFLETAGKNPLFTAPKSTSSSSKKGRTSS